METKLSKLKTALENGDIAKAISIAAKFPNLGQERNAILDAHTAITNPRWVKGLGKDVGVCIDKGVESLIAKYGVGRCTAV